ncbi:bifunctional tetrahydrofolate synthase/dihydrofolate synthase [Marinobacter sp. M-5]|jgi:dihydrofolate synthase/folylpolyglutamate synthase|uniref:bifunctional tetrahydrofolate synthase/dihydrofolate synthase n=1 Tax=Marinobacter sp. M-5 TaxID=3081089 RepID=UPI00293C6F3C|nr:bifunctional tetrahydrofolate synthase/dihydrofolate synthase [Marinobacter sp. M-5]MDV3503591.1 bifunctional tetrahydrofolate synthase/dihydrofolate synthase [Marinobacter sp. M-5]
MSHKAEGSDRHPQAPGAGATLDQWLSYLESIHPSEIDMGLERVLMVLRRLFPRKPPARVVTVGGTNGKGSTVACLEAMLLDAGRTVGAYTSPHLQHYSERVRINGTDVSDAELIDAFCDVEVARKNVTLTYFEFGTLAAFLILAKAGVQDWILEVGLGGRLDAVNVLDADLAVITSVDIDHVAFLGDNREVIGFEKAGILRPGIAAVYADIDPPRSVLQQVAAQKVRLQRLGENYRLVPEEHGHRLEFSDGAALQIADSVPLPLHSVAAAAVAFHELEPGVGPDTIAQSIARVRVPGRFERLGQAPALYVDVGHNPHAARWLADRVGLAQPEIGRVRAVYAALADKDVEGVVAAMSGVVDEWYLGGLSCHRGLGSDALVQRIREVPVPLKSREFGTVSLALSAALEDAGAQDLVIVFGSFFTVAEARQCLGVAGRGRQP